jgi:hypothetical protein
MEANDLDDIFILPFSQQAIRELEELQDSLQAIQYDEESMDIWKPNRGNNYAAKIFYNHVYDVLDTHPIFKIVWKSKCTPRIKFFFWLLLVDRLYTKTILTRRNIGARENDLCVMCNMGVNETIEHLFFNCPFAIQCWSRINVY